MQLKKSPLIIFWGSVLLALTGFMPVRATVMVGDVTSYGKTYINYFMNHGYLERDKPYLYEYSVKALERVRQQLVKEGKITDIWVVLKVPSTVFKLDSEKSVLEKKATCNLGYGDTVGNPPAPELDNCYSIYFVGEPNYQNFLTMLLALPQVTEQQPSVVIDNLEELTKSFSVRASTYSGGAYFSKPVWSPNSDLVAFGIWKDGLFNYEIYDVKEDKYFQTAALNHHVAAEPIWSPNSRYLVFASLSDINIFDTSSGQTRRLDISGETNGKNFETLLSFDIVENKLLYAFDKNLLTDYAIYELDPKATVPGLRAQDVSYLSWGRPGGDGFKQVTSPDGRFEAKVVDTVQGSTRSVNKLIQTNPPPSAGRSQPPELPSDRKGLQAIVWPSLGVIGGIMVFWVGWLLGARHARTQLSATHSGSPNQ